MENQAIIEKLRKLIAHEKSAREIGSIAEAEAFAVKIQSLLDEYKLGMDEIEYAEREAQEPIDWELISMEEGGFTERKSKVYWQILLASTIAKCNGCQIVTNGRSNSLYFVGRASDRELSKMLFVYMLELAGELSKKDALANREEQRRVWKECKSQCRSQWSPYHLKKKMRQYRDAFLMGFAGAVSERLQQQHDEMIAANESSTAMVHIKKDAVAIHEFLSDKGLHKRRPVRATVRNEDALARGEQAGKSVALTPNRFSTSSRPAIGLLNS